MQYVARMLTNTHANRALKTHSFVCVSGRHSRNTIVKRAVSSSTSMQQQSVSHQANGSAAAGDGLGKPLLSVAPMMDWTDIHYRQLARLISKRTWLWTEMVVDRTILHAQPLDKWLWYPPEQHPIVLQLGGSDPSLLQQAAAAAAAYGYDEINLNCGCPSDRVAGAGCFGASLMLEPQLVAECMAAVAAGVAAAGTSPRISVKCRLGVDDADSYAQLAAFVQTVSQAGGVTDFVIHARKCLLNGITPSQNRSVPPLRHDWVWALKRDFPHLSFQLNGGITTTHAAAEALSLPADAAFGIGPNALDGVMIGRAAYNDPWGVLGDADVAIFGAQRNGAVNRGQVVEQYCKYGDAMLGRWRTRDDGSHDPNIRTIIKPLLNLFHGERGGKRWKNAVDIALRTLHPKTVTELIEATIRHVPDDVLDAPPRSAAAAAAFANNGATPAPYTLMVNSVAVDRLALPEDRARGDWEPQGKKKRSKGGKGKSKGDAADSCSGSVCGSQSETEEQQQQQQQQSVVQQQQQQQQQQSVVQQQQQQQQQQHGDTNEAQPPSLQQQSAADVSSLQQQLDSLGLQQQQPEGQQPQQQEMANGHNQPSDAAAAEGQPAAHPIAAVLA